MSMFKTAPPPLPSRALSAAFTVADGRVTVGTLVHACGVTTSVVGRWLRHGGQVRERRWTADRALLPAKQL
jgi:hypothetical protein